MFGVSDEKGNSAVKVSVFEDGNCCGGNFFKTWELTTSMQQKPSREANSFSASHEIPRILWNPKVHYLNHNRPPPVPYPEPDYIHENCFSKFLRTDIGFNYLFFLVVFFQPPPPTTTPKNDKFPLSLRAKLVQHLFLAPQPPVGQGLLIHEVSRSHTTTFHSR